MNKRELRKYYREKRLSIDDSQRSRLDDLLLIRFQQWVVPSFVEYVLSYWPLREKGEINTFLITDFLEFRIPGLQVAYPVTDFEQQRMQAVGVTDDTDYIRNLYGIAEPVSGDILEAPQLDLILVPLLAFDLQGHRLGYGRGFYDRYLAGCRPDAIKLGFSYFEPETAIPEKDEFDIPLTACITPDQIYEF